MGWCSDFIGRNRVFQVMFLAQTIVFFLLSGFTASEDWQFSPLSSCYAMAAASAPCRRLQPIFFGPRKCRHIYGLMLTAWGCAGVLGPTLIAHLRQSTGHYTEALT